MFFQHHFQLSDRVSKNFSRKFGGMLEGCAHFWPFFEVTFSPDFWVIFDKTKAREAL